ncbi:hypothetical protein GJ496_002405 [Pomphorhynchus laevis]|nr:hypothetical protein GJ496_002405 [Pomphorhynchus laevis]
MLWLVIQVNPYIVNTKPSYLIPKHQKLEKAEILEMTVAYIIQINTLFRRIQYRQQVTPIDYMQPHLYAIDQINEEHYVNDEHKSTFSCKKRKSTDCDNLRYYHERKYCCRNDDNSLNYCVKRRRTCTSEDNVWRPWLIN